MKIHQNFIGGNIVVKEEKEGGFILENEIRDSAEDWFYWAFCIEGAEGKELTFEFGKNRLGYFGPAVSYDLKNWHWLGSTAETSFTYRFSKEESKVYFAHHMLYHPDRFLEFADRHGLAVREFCKGYKGSSVPCVKFGDGTQSIILTARHHACESTGNYVLEGVLESLAENPIPDTRVLCVPFVDYEGVIRGDQGKGRLPHDHNRDYDAQGAESSIYPECAEIIKYAEKYGCRFGFDFHSPWHRGGQNDNVFIVQNLTEKLEGLNKFGELLEESVTADSFKYEHKNDYPPKTGWNKPGHQFSVYMAKMPGNDIAFTLETAYFGTDKNRADCKSLSELGRCFARALRKYAAWEDENARQKGY